MCSSDLACWAGYILVNRVVGARLPGVQGPAAAAGVSALLYVPVGVSTLVGHPVTWAALSRAASAGILCSAVPMVADVLALRRVPARFFGVFMSVNPLFAALTGLVVLGQSLGLVDWLAVAAVVTANAVSVSTSGRRQPLRFVHVAAPRPYPYAAEECQPGSCDVFLGAFETQLPVRADFSGLPRERFAG